ncbi:MAG: hypothetical protein AAB423_00245 [Patescibacteria group bacterium]
MSEFRDTSPIQEGSIEDQRMLLLDIQGQLLTAEYAGLLGKIDAMMGENEYRGSFFNDCDLLRPVVALSKLRTEFGDSIDIYNIRLVGTKNTPVSVSEKYLDFPVAESIGSDVVLPKDGFDDEDVSLVTRQIALLHTAREEGLLPNLSGNMAYIFDPSTAIAMKKQV